MSVKVFAAVLLVAAATTLGLTTANGGAAAWAHRALGVVPHHHGSAHRVAAPRKTAGFTCGSSCSSYELAINTFFTNVAAESAAVSRATKNVYDVATQYCEGVAPGSTSCGGEGTPIAYSSTFGGAYVDGRPLPASGCNDAVTVAAVHYADKYCLTDSQLQTEIKRVIAAQGWTIDSTNLFFIFTPANVGICIKAGNASANACTTNVFCAYHSFTPSSIIYAVEPDDAQIPDAGCDPGPTPVGSGADATINTVSHEQNEAITDPLGGGWSAADNSENGDLCLFNFGSAVPDPPAPNGQPYNQSINGTDYYLQQEYSNTDGGCLQQPGGTVSQVLEGDGAGPLIYHGGSVMTTNTVHAIYWVPAAPANIKPPTISGTAKVGKKLTASHGNWSRVPKFTYRWLRCSAAGTSCKGIAKATGVSYTLVKADRGHRLEVRVTATNAAGHASTTSIPTAKVRS